MTSPRVVFVLLAYNQAPWVRQACEAALNQDYQPLDIIFSDDASSDETFAIMRAVAADYRGPHRVWLNRNPQNLGLIRHVNTLHALADADLLVAAAGDDISLPNRTTTLVRAFQDAAGAAHSFHSAVQTIDQAGRITCPLLRPHLTDDHPDPAQWQGRMATLIGATHAWTRPLFERFGPITEPDAYEDLVLAYRAMLLGGLRYIDTPLVQYREGVGMSSPAHRDPVQALQRRLRLEPAVLRQRQQDCRTLGRKSLARTLGREAAGRQLMLGLELGSERPGARLIPALRKGLWRYWLRGCRKRLKHWMRARRRVSGGA